MGPAYRLLALDLDGTLIDRSLQFRPAVQAAVAAAQAAGVTVTLATGRMVRTTRPFADQLNITSPLICYQGAHVQALSGEVIYDNPLDGALAAQIVQLAAARDIYIQAYINDELYIAAERPEADEYRSFSTVPLPVHAVGDLAAWVRTNPPTKLLWIAAPELLLETLDRWGAQFQGQASIFRSHDRFGEAAAPDSSKGVALAVLAAQLGIPRAQVMAIGDRQNDAPMLQWAGLGLAMGDADEHARSAADAVLPPFAEDGVAWAIQRWILEQPHDNN